MPSNRPFLASLFVAFRAHSALQKPATSVQSAASSSVPSASSSSSPPAVSPVSPSPGVGGSVVISPTRSNIPCSPPGPQQSPPQSISNTRQHSPSRRRRSSSSSTEGMMNGLTGEKWWIGGRAGDGQARFYQLQPVRHRSLDRLSLDRLSL
ncbi:hypothetical protein TWF694_002777 [Orbilia ellipsospora]|uniref:Uncharacterized protein n=1 Tax=Orbilia ellipsospora TaxID=2528407 RepID=A0AAV9WZM9_9PEZI